LPVTETGASAEAPLADDELDDVSELLEQLARQVSVLGVCEARLAASRNAPRVRRVGRDLAAAVVVGLAFLAAFVLANVAAVQALSATLPGWAAPLVVAAAWVGVGAVLALSVRARVKRAATGRQQDAEAAREAAEQAARETLERLVPAISREIALAAVPIAGDIAEGVVDAGEDLLEGADDFVEDLVDDVPGGGAVTQVWDVALAPGRLGFRVASAFLRLGEAENRAHEDRESSD
jgi:Putative Actinobacterial Holin-X, holin superfamily III